MLEKGIGNMTPVKYRVVGAITVLGRSQEIRPTSGRARAMLACLAWQPGLVVPDSAMIEQVWEGVLPADPQDALYTAAKRLRRNLAEVSAGDTLIRTQGGYVLEADPWAIDLHRFRLLAAQARQEADMISAARLYERAMRLMNGTPLADVSTAWATRARQTLRHEWLSVRLAALETWLQVGRHADLVPDLVCLAEENPLNERVVGLLMRALDGSGRHVEALECYERARAKLIEEIGDEPGPELREIHERLLRRNAALRT